MTNRNFVRTPRRARTWAITTTTSGTLVAATEAGKLFFDLQSGLETDLGRSLNDVTASAIRLDMYLSFQATAVVGDRTRYTWGIGWFQNDAITAGVVSLPNPVTDHFDWMAHGTGEVIADVASVISAPRNAHIQIHNDSMRKQRENHSTLGLIISANVLDDTMVVVLSGRVLFLLP